MKIIYFTLLFLCPSLSHANLEDFRPGSWNIQGTGASSENKWVAYIKQILINSPNNQNFRDIVALQEVGGPPESAIPITSGQDLIPEEDPSQTHILVHQYRWLLGNRTVPTQAYIYIADVASRVNVGIVTARRPDRLIILPSPRSGYHAARPMLGVVFGNTVFYSVHAISGEGRSDAHDIIRDIYNYHTHNADPAIRQMQWMAMGDFNMIPATMFTNLRINNSAIAEDVQLVFTGELSQQSGRELDYAVIGPFDQSNVPNIAASFFQASRVGRLGSDHYPIYFNCEL